jgi:hypothetical protein
LTFVAEELRQPWAQDLSELLREIMRTVAGADGGGYATLSLDDKHAFTARYTTILAVGLQANPPPEPTGKRRRPKRGKAGT